MTQQRGFTLVELSIVLVILGLLVGGVLTGQSLIRAAELRSVTTQYARYQAAVMTFRDKYFALPGDMTNAQSYWGVANATAATCITTASTTAVTCNGDGNGIIDLSAGSNENYRFWQHLANAGLIEGNYSGITQGSTSYTSTTANSPSGRISASLWYVVGWGARTGTTYIFDGQYDNAFEFGMPTVNGDPSASVMKPEDSYNIDMKIDDGKPATGKYVVRSAMTGAATNCTDAANSAALSANYQLSNTALSCVAIFRQVF